MDNFFIARPPFQLKNNSSLVNIINKSLRLIKTGYQLQPRPDPVADMNTIEQRINYFHLLDGVITNNIPGEVVELGCFTGQCAMLFQKTLQLNNSDKQLHLYDNFESKFKIAGSVEATLIDNFKKADLRLPTLHKGYFQSTVPAQLPAVLSFVHIDCGFGGDPLLHKAIILHCLESVYPRMSKGAVCVLMDYHDQASDNGAYDANPGVKLACDDFLATRPEKIVALYGNQYAHGFFKKV